MTLGLQHGKNILCPYSDDWPIQYKHESDRILTVCGNLLTAIEHVGSTAVPGLTAKPIIDIAVGVESLDVADEMLTGMESIGYDYPGDVGIPNDRIFGRDPGFRLFLVHVVIHKSSNWNHYLIFRNALKTSNKLRDEYVKLKTESVRKQPEGRAAYSELKSEFINMVLTQKI